MMDKIPVNDPASFRDALTGNLMDTPMSIAFFSKQNMQILQNGVRANVYKESDGQYLIGLQDYNIDHQTSICMRLYLEKRDQKHLAASTSE